MLLESNLIICTQLSACFTAQRTAQHRPISNTAKSSTQIILKFIQFEQNERYHCTKHIRTSQCEPARITPWTSTYKLGRDIGSVASHTQNQLKHRLFNHVVRFVLQKNQLDKGNEGHVTGPVCIHVRCIDVVGFGKWSSRKLQRL